MNKIVKKTALRLSIVVVIAALGSLFITFINYKDNNRDEQIPVPPKSQQQSEPSSILGNNQNEENGTDKKSSEDPVIEADKRTAILEKNISKYIKANRDLCSKFKYKGIIANSDKLDEKALKDSKKLYDEFLSLLRFCDNNAVIVDKCLSIWKYFFDTDSFKKDPKAQKLFSNLAYDEQWASQSFEYLSLIGFEWVLDNADSIRKETLKINVNQMPERIRKLIAEDKKDPENASNQVPIIGIRHILYGSYTKDRAEHLFNESKIALEEAGCNLKGKDIVDVGAGSGMMFPLFRKAMGPDATLYAQDVDPFTVDAMAHLNKQYNIKVVMGKRKTIGLEPNSVDIVNLTGVHMGEGLTSNYDQYTRPWIKSMHTALRANGYLVIDDGNEYLITEGLQEKVEEIGFICISYKPIVNKGDNFVFVFQAVK